MRQDLVVPAPRINDIIPKNRSIAINTIAPDQLLPHPVLATSKCTTNWRWLKTTI